MRAAGHVGGGASCQPKGIRRMCGCASRAGQWRAGSRQTSGRQAVCHNHPARVECRLHTQSGAALPQSAAFTQSCAVPSLLHFILPALRAATWAEYRSAGKMLRPADTCSTHQPSRVHHAVDCAATLPSCAAIGAAVGLAAEEGPAVEVTPEAASLLPSGAGAAAWVGAAAPATAGASSGEPEALASSSRLVLPVPGLFHQPKKLRNGPKSQGGSPVCCLPLT